MVSGKYSALSGAITREQSIANTTANLANVSTVGYKKTRMSFEAMLKGETQIRDTKGINYNRVRGNYVDFSQGPLKETENPFDIAIQGNGFFKLRSIDGDLLTRKGNFVLDEAGRLLSDTGMPVLSNGGGEINIPEADTTNIVIDDKGIIHTINSNGESSEVAQLAIIDVDDRSVLTKVKDTAFSIPQGIEELQAENFTVSQGSLEISNVNMTDEMTKMIHDNRLYQSYHNILESYSKLGEKITELGTIA